MEICVEKYPQLRMLCWNRPPNTILGGEEALALYERNWRFIDVDTLEDTEKALIDTLVADYGHGILMVA